MEHPVIETPSGFLSPETKSDFELLNFKLKYNFKNLNFSLRDIDNEKLKLIVKEDDSKEIESNRYETNLELKQLKTTHKYFKMFDNYKEFKNNFIELCIPNNIQIIYYDYEKIEINLDLKLISNNLFKITLNKAHINQKDQIKFILKELNEKNKLINILNLKIKDFEKNLYLKEDKITNLEKEIKNLKLKDLEKEKKINEIKNSLIELNNNKIIKKELNNDNNNNKIIIKGNAKNKNGKKIKEILDYLENKYYCRNWLDEDKAILKIKELKYNLKDIEYWIESLL